MSGQEDEKSTPTWRFLWELKIAAGSVADVYVSLSLFGGHYLRVDPKDFLDAINDMQAASETHIHPKRFQFTMENNVLWVHSSMMPTKRGIASPGGSTA